MENGARNLIERATQQARRLLEDDFWFQLEGSFDVFRDGTIGEVSGGHLSPHRDKVLAAIAHKRAVGMTEGEAAADYVRDLAFTTLNRFAALKMLEVRGLVQECISKGEQSSGYREFCGMAPGIALLPDTVGYRLYLESLFDEFSTEIKVLFDRRDSASILWPRRQTFDALLLLLNGEDLKDVWAEDETIGWVYQFFNSSEERRKMRDESPSPRNSRELAVRNQFFTPRYVVQFLTDNTLGRLWLEMYGGTSRLKASCECLIPLLESYTGRYRSKDPRDLRILDPACGSGHFLLYAFDLLLEMYEEAWSIEERAPDSELTGKSLRRDFPDLMHLRRSAPRLIIEHNLYGVDIDPRCAQITALALWLRAQRAWKDLKISASQRPQIAKTHIVVAEPMPGEAAIVDEFALSLQPPLLRDIFKKMVRESALAGELGTLLQLEDSIGSELRGAREEFIRQRESSGYLPGLEPQGKEGDRDLSGIDDQAFFYEAEARIIEALRRFSEAATGGTGIRRRLFAGDSAQGIALFDTLRTRFDVILTNPPFGDAIASTRDFLANTYPESRLDLYACFVHSALNRLREHGRIGVLSSRLGLFLGTLEDWRSLALLGGKGSLERLADLGHNVLDGALVEAAAYVIGLDNAGFDNPWACDLLKESDKQSALKRETNKNSGAHWRPGLLALSRDLPSKPIPYWLPRAAVDHLLRPGRIGDINAAALVGLQTDDDFRFVRLAWEVPLCTIGPNQTWRYFAKGGEYSPYYDDIHLLVNWKDNARELRAFIEQRYSWTKNARSVGRYGEPGLTYPERTTSEFSPRPLPKGSVFSIAGPAILCDTATDSFALLALFYTRWYRLLIEAYIGGGDAVTAGSAARHYKTGIVNALPFPSIEPTVRHELIEIGRKCSLSRASEFSLDETSRLFSGFPLMDVSWEQYCNKLLSSLEDQFVCREVLSSRSEEIVRELFQLSTDDLKFIHSAYGPHPAEWPDVQIESSVLDLLETNYAELCRRLVQRNGYSRQISKLSHWTQKSYEAVAQLQRTRVRAVIEKRKQEDRVPAWWAAELAAKLISYFVGIAFGRWSMSTTSSCVGLDAEFLLSLPPRPPAGAVDRTSRLDIMVDDPGHTSDIVTHVVTVAEAVGFSVEALDHLASKAANRSEVRQYLALDFFEQHITQYSKSRRTAPVYWQLATNSASYSIWLYLHALSADTLYKVQNEYAAPKLAHEERRLADLMEAAGANPSARQRREIAAQNNFVDDLRAFVDEVRRIAPLWKPTLADGVVVTMAPLWRLISHRPWQKILKAKWDELCAGHYDWAGMAMHLWPERVVRKCRTDRSLAIAHELEDVFWAQQDDGKWTPRSSPTVTEEQLIKERLSGAVRSALNNLLESNGGGATNQRRRDLHGGVFA